MTVEPAIASTPGSQWGGRGSLSTKPQHQVLRGPSVLDSTHAYTVVAVSSEKVEPGPASQANSLPLAVDSPYSLQVVATRLADGAVSAWTVVEESLSLPQGKELSAALALSPDRSSLLLTASRRDDDEPAIGLRLSLSDLSVLFDARTLLAPGDRSRPCGEAVHIIHADGRDSVVFLCDSSVLTSPAWAADVAAGDWVYGRSLDGSRLRFAEGSAHARHRVTGEFLALQGPEDDALGHAPERTIWMDDDRLVRQTVTSFQVREPGRADPLLAWTSEERPVPYAACLLGEVLYSMSDSEGRIPVGSLEMTDLSTGESWTARTRLAPLHGLGVTAWGVATEGWFYPATEWLGEDAG